MKKETARLIRQFDQHNDPLTHIDTLHLLLWGDKLCIVGFDREGQALTTKIYEAPMADVGLIEDVFINEPLVAGPQPITHIWLADNRSMLIPEPFFDREAAQEWAKKFHHIEQDERLDDHVLKGPEKIRIVYPIRETLAELFSKYFGEALVGPMSMLYNDLRPETSLQIALMDKKALISLFGNGRLLNHQWVDITDVLDLVYKLALLMEQHQVRSEKLKVSFHALMIGPPFLSELKAYFPQISLEGTEEQLSFQFLSQLNICAS